MKVSELIGMLATCPLDNEVEIELYQDTDGAPMESGEFYVGAPRSVRVSHDMVIISQVLK
jgi:hypothetical protein